MMPKAKLKQTTLSQSTKSRPKKPLATAGPSSAPAKKTQKKKRPSPKESSDSNEQSDDEEEVHQSPRKRRRIAYAPPSDDDDDTPAPQGLSKRKKGSKGREETPSPPLRRRKLTKGVRPPSDEDEDDLESDHILTNRFRTRGKKTQYEKNLERLKLKRQKLPPSSEHNSSSGSADSESSDESNEQDQPIPGAKPHEDTDSLFSGSDEESFIVEDDGVVPELPQNFSMSSHQNLKDSFTLVFQFFVHMAVRPPADRHDFMEHQMKHEPYFSTPLANIRRKLIGIRDSLVTSSVWRPEFKRPLDKYPEFGLFSLDFTVQGCDACHLGGRKSTLYAQLTGDPYDKFGFEDLASDSEDSDEDEDSNKRSAEVRFNLGRFCGQRTRVYHQLTHWEHALFQVIRSEVDNLHANASSEGFVRVGFAGGKKPPKNLQDADGIYEWLVDRGEVNTQWLIVKVMLENAEKLEMGGKLEDD